MNDEERRKRAEKRRQSATLAWSTLETRDRDPDPIGGAEALSLAWRLTCESWFLARRETPRYDRASIPHRFVRGRLT